MIDYKTVIWPNWWIEFTVPGARKGIGWIRPDANLQFIKPLTIIFVSRTLQVQHHCLPLRRNVSSVWAIACWKASVILPLLRPRGSKISERWRSCEVTPGPTNSWLMHGTDHQNGIHTETIQRRMIRNSWDKPESFLENFRFSTYLFADEQLSVKRRELCMNNPPAILLA